MSIRCINCAEFTETLRILMDHIDRRGAFAASLTKDGVTWNPMPGRSDDHPFVETALVLDPHGEPITARGIAAEHLAETEMFLRALSGTGSDAFHFHAPPPVGLLSRWRRERLVPDFHDRVDVHIMWGTPESMRVRRKSPVAVQPVTDRHPGRGRPPAAIVRHRRRLARTHRNRLLRAT